MAQTSGFFEAMQLADGTYDRVYLASQFASYFANFISNGVYANPTNQLKVVADDGMNVIVRAGNAFINGYWFKLDNDMRFTLSNAGGTLSRYDAIVVQYSLTDRVINLVIKEGEFSANPIKPEILRTDDYFELCLAYIKVEAGTLSIEDANIEDTRTNETICGFVASMIQTLSTEELFSQYTSAYNIWFRDTSNSFAIWWNQLKEEIGYDTEQFTVLFNAWFDSIKGKLEGDPATAITLRIDDIEKRMYGYENKTTSINEDGSILEVFGNGKVQTTKTEDEGIVVRMFDSEGLMLYKKVIKKLEDGSISEEVTVLF